MDAGPLDSLAATPVSHAGSLGRRAKRSVRVAIGSRAGSLLGRPARQTAGLRARSEAVRRREGVREQRKVG